MSQIFERIKRKCQFSKKRAEKRIEKEVENKQITQFCNMDNQLALMNKEQIYVYNTENGHLNYVLRQNCSPDTQKQLYIISDSSNCTMFIYYFLFALIEQLYFKNRLVFKQKLMNPCTALFYYIGKNHGRQLQLVCSQQTVFKASECKLHDSKFPEIGIRLQFNFYQTKTIFKQLSQNYLTIDSICMLPQHKLFLYNKQEKELYLCDLNKLYQTYPTFAFLGDYEHSIFKIDKTQNCLPFQHITGVYNKVYADKIEYHRNYLLLVQEKDPISEIVWKEQYCLEDEGTLSYMTKNGKRYRA